MNPAILKKRNLLVFLALALFFSDCRSIPQPRELIAVGDLVAVSEYLDSLIKAQMREYRIPGMAVTVVHEGKVLFSRLYGKAHDRKDIPLTDGSVFMAGSLTKSFTALAVTNLIHAGRISPDDDIKTYLPGFSRQSHGKQKRPITVRHLLTHTSGLPIDYYARFTGERKYSDEELLSLLSEEYLCFQPGTAVKYSNIGYKLLGMMVERVSGKSFEEYLQETVLRPVGMTGSGFSQEEVGVTAAGHDGDRGNEVMSMIDIRDNPSSGLYTTITDMTSFLRFLSAEEKPSGAFISGPGAVQSIIQNADFSIDTFYDGMHIYSTGWYLGFYDFPGQKFVLSNSGNVNGFSSELTYVPKAKLGMAVLSNSSLGWKADIVIADRGLRAYLRALGMDGANAGKGTDKKRLSLSPPPQDVTGKYAAFGFDMNIFKKGDSLRAKFWGPAAYLRSIGKGLYKGEVCILCACMNVARVTEYDDLRFGFYTNREGKAFLYLEPSYDDTYFSLPLHRVRKPDIPKGFSRNYGVWKLTEETG
ncbi:MAG: beta-lactamase family protein [Deltaproteobacteria bacterium]|nr:beta-lactamase family protein [Deltaproteobacteria bacterium]